MINRVRAGPGLALVPPESGPGLVPATGSGAVAATQQQAPYRYPRALRPPLQPAALVQVQCLLAFSRLLARRYQRRKKKYWRQRRRSGENSQPRALSPPRLRKTQCISWARTQPILAQEWSHQARQSTDSATATVGAARVVVIITTARRWQQHLQQKISEAQEQRLGVMSGQAVAAETGMWLF